MLAEIGEGEREGRCHAQALRDPQSGEDAKIWRDRQQARRHRQQREAEQDAGPPVDMRAEEADDEASNRHAEGAGVDGKAHRRRRDAVMARQRGQDRLRREEIDDGQEGGEADDERTKRKARGMRVHRHRGRFDRRGKIGHGTALR
ncbi:hypothetical protein ACVIQT_004044 [Bradyrhizobium diazoefficiens]